MDKRAGYDNIKDHGFDKRSAAEVRKFQSKGGKASGETRRKKANFRKTLNLLLTTKIESPEFTPLLEEAGLDSTLESALNMVMIKKGLSGDVTAYNAICKVIQTEEEIAHKNNELEKQKIEIEKQRNELERQRLEIEKLKSQISSTEADECETDGFMEALKATVKESISEEVDFIET